jgi:uncharacterized membrane protein
VSEIAFLVSLVALVLVFRARSRITALEDRLRILTASAPEAPAAPIDGPAENADDTAPEPAPGIAAGNPDRPSPWGGPSRRPRPVAPATQGPGAGDRLVAWLRENWIYPAAGAALVLAGVFLVQYAVDSGLLTAEARVVLALALGGALVVGAEALRRRPAAGAILPATFAGAGIAIAMAAVLAALHLYDMVSPAAALIALGLLALLAIVLGWLHGPMLPALGLVAGSAAPFLLGGAGPVPPALFGYFGALALAGLGIDAARRWGWVTWLALAGPLAGAVMMRLAGGDALAFALALTVIAAAAMTLPFGRVAPVVDGPGALAPAPVRGVRASLAASAVLAAAAVALMPGWEGPGALTTLALLVAIWARRAPALAEQMLLPLLALPAWIVWQAVGYGPLVLDYAAFRGPEAAPPLEPSILVGLGWLAGLAMVWRGEAEDPGRLAPWTLAGLAMPFGALAALETTWQPAQQLGVPLWAGHALALAAWATALALRYAARDAGQGPRLGAAAAMAFTLIALALAVVIGQAGLTVAVVLLLVASAALDRRFDIPGLGLFQILASLALGWRLVIDPGLGWHLYDAAAPEALLSLLATLAGPAAALWLARDLADAQPRRAARLVVETGLTGAAAIGAAVLIARLLPDGLGLHAQLGLQASVMIALAWVQVRRMALPFGRRLRQGLAWLFGLLAGGALVAAASIASPVFGDWPFISRVLGWPLLNDLIPAYLVPGVLLVGLGGWHWLRPAGWALVALWAGSAIRHLWQGPRMDLSRGVEPGELYAYTAALLLAGAVLVGRAILAGRADLRRLGLALVGVAKAFLIDASGLDGLMRVGAFLGLGLSLAGLAWVNGWAVARERAGMPKG